MVATFKIKRNRKIIGNIRLETDITGKLYIESIYVHEKYRNKGIASKLLTKVIVFADKNKKVLFLYASPGDFQGAVDRSKIKSVMRLYSRFGFKRIGKTLKMVRKYKGCE